MGVLFEYFAAISDELAAGTIDWIGGPGAGPEVAVPSPRRGLLRRRAATGANDAAAQSDRGRSLPTVDGKGIDPVVMMGRLEAQLTGRTYDQIAALVSEPLAVRDGGQVLVIRLNVSLVDALAASTNEKLAADAELWSQTEEFWGRGDSKEVTSFLVDLAQLARDARSRGDRIYCWVCV